MPKLYNLARVTTATTGTGTMTLGPAVVGYLSFADAGVQNGDVVYYAIKDGSNSEIGRGTYASSGATLTRDTVYESTSAGSKINLSGTAEVFITPPAEALAAGVLTTRGDLLRMGANGIERVALGSDGQFLQSDGTDPVWGAGLNIATTTKTDTFSSATTGAWTDITGLSVTITPRSTASTIVLVGMIGIVAHSAGSVYIGLRWATSGGTALLQGDAASSRTRTLLTVYGAGIANNVNDGPTVIASHAPANTSAQTYKMQFHIGTGTVYVNRDATDSDTSAFHRAACFLMAMEVT
jgi:hypothetical protein